MSESLGLSIGVANLVAARVGSPAVTRSSVLTLFEHRATEVGLPEENPNLTEPGLVLRGFVERVGDRAPLVAADGTKYLGGADGRSDRSDGTHRRVRVAGDHLDPR